MDGELLHIRDLTPRRLLRSVCTGRSKVRQSLLFAIWYWLCSTACLALASCISSVRPWLLPAEITTALLLESIHFRWTKVILFKAHQVQQPSTYPWPRLSVPTVLCAIAKMVTISTPSTIQPSTQAHDIGTADAIATRDVGVLVLTIALHFAVLYLLWAALICCEAIYAFQTSAITSERRSANDFTISDTTLTWILRRCYRRLLLRLVGLHLQAAGILICIELGVHMVLIALLRD